MKTLSSMFAMAMAANAHMIMRTPQPAGNPTSSPLTDANYPCQLIDISSGKKTTMNVGEAQTLSFTGGATHGGGSCQVSLAKGLSPTASTKFMVIHSIEGGCPADADGNLSDNAAGTNAAQFKFTIPDHPDLGPGDYTLAWTWNNKIGNREFYMNCAAVTIAGAKKKRYAPTNMGVSKRQQAPLPDMLVANILGKCSIEEGVDLQYPDPGASLEIGSKAKLKAPTGNCGSVGASNPGAGTGTSPSAAASGGFSSANSVVATSAPSATANPGNPNNGNPNNGNPNNGNPNNGGGSISQSVGGGFATVSASGAGSPPTSTAAVAQSSAAAASPSAVAASPASSGVAPVGTGTSSTGTGSSGSCNVGDWDCAADGGSFTRCIAGGTWSASIQMSAGMKCVPGISANFAYNLTGSNAKRDMRTHISRRRNNAHAAVLS